MKVFISGIIQGSSNHLDDLHGQDYRSLIRQALNRKYPAVEVFDPWQIYPDAAGYSPQKAVQTLLEEIEMAGACDLLLAYLPQASMGSALEMWAAYQAGAAIHTISPLTTNWVVLTLSDTIHASLEGFLEFVDSGGLDEALDGGQQSG